MIDARVTRAARAALLLGAFALSAAAGAPRASAQSARTRVVVLGTGNPVADPDRFGPAVAIVVDSTPYLFDAGVGVVRRFAAAIRGGVGASDVTALRRVYFTHLHSDHTLGYPDLILSTWTLGATRPLEAYGPRGLKAMTDHVLAAYAEDVKIRMAAEGAPGHSLQAPAVNVHEVDAGVVYRDSLVTVTAFAVPHGTWPQAFGYRVQTPDRVVVLSGDTGPTDAVVAQCNGCDLLLYEGGAVAESSATPYYLRFHTTTEQLARVATAARPKLLVLYHQRPSSAATDAGYRRLRALYAGPFVVARDLDVFR